MLQNREEKPLFVPSPALNSDVERALSDFNRAFNLRHSGSELDFRVSGVRDGHVLLSVALPVGMTRVFASLLQSLNGFFQVVDQKARIAALQDRPVDPDEIERKNRAHSEFRKAVLETYQGFQRQGYTSKEALSRTNLALKAQNHPWANYDSVKAVLSAAGYLRKER